MLCSDCVNADAEGRQRRQRLPLFRVDPNADPLPPRSEVQKVLIDGRVLDFEKTRVTLRAEELRQLANETIHGGGEGVMPLATTEEIRRALHALFAPGYVVLDEVWVNGKRVDMLALAKVERAPGIIGIEVKISRADWQEELRNPPKAEAPRAACNQWWLATNSRRVFRDEEVPPTWGVLIVEGAPQRVVTHRDAPVRAQEPDHDLLRSVMRRVAQTMSVESDFEQRVEHEIRARLHQAAAMAEIRPLFRKRP